MKRTAQWHCRSFRWRAKSTVIGFLSSYNSHMTHLHLKLRELAAKRCGILWCGSNTNHSCCTRLHLSSVLSPTVSDCKHWLLVVSCLTSLSVEWRVGKADSFSLRQVKEHRYGNVRITLLSHHITSILTVLFSYIRRLHPSTMHYSFCRFRVPTVGKSQHAVCLRLQPLFFFFACYDVLLEMESCFVLASWLWMVSKEEIEGFKCQLCHF